MKREELLRQLWQLREWVEEQEILEYELQKKEKLLKVTIEEAQAEYLQEKEAKFYASEAYHRIVEKKQAHEKMKKMGNHAMIFTEIAMTILAIAFIFLGMPLWQAIAWWMGVLVFTIIIITSWIKHSDNLPEKAQILDEVLEEAKSSPDYQSLEHSLLADYLKLEISFLRNKVETGRKRLMNKSVNRDELIDLIQMVEQGNTEKMEQAIDLLQ